MISEIKKKTLLNLKRSNIRLITDYLFYATHVHCNIYIYVYINICVCVYVCTYMYLVHFYYINDTSLRVGTIPSPLKHQEVYTIHIIITYETQKNHIHIDIWKIVYYILKINNYV